jgi:hypothetical protein
LTLLLQVNPLPLPFSFTEKGRTWIEAAVWLCASAFSLRVIGDFRYVGLFKSIRGTRFAHYDTLVFTPLCLFLATAYWVAIID